MARITKLVYGYSMRLTGTNLRSHCTETLPAGTYMSHVAVLIVDDYDAVCHMLCDTLLYNILYYNILYYNILYYSILYYNILYYNILY